MKQGQWTDRGIEVREAEPGALKTGWARLRVGACGICGTDLHRFHGRAAFRAGVPGHEFVGTVESGLAGLPDRLYAVLPLYACGNCDYCHSGWPNHCADARYVGVHDPGGIAVTADAPAGNLYPVDPSLSPLEASMAEPLAVCVRAMDLAQIDLDSRVLVLGAGTLGLTSAMLARDRAAEIAITVRYPQQRQVAERLGVTALNEDEAASWATEMGPDTVIETVGGDADTVNVALRACRPAGRIVLVGSFAATHPTEVALISRKSLTVVGSLAYASGRRGLEFGAAVTLLARYREELGWLQTHQFPLDDVAGAFAAASDKNSGCIKVTVMPN